jgi:hypothetical protein
LKTLIKQFLFADPFWSLHATRFRLVIVLAVGVTTFNLMARNNIGIAIVCMVRHAEQTSDNSTMNSTNENLNSTKLNTTNATNDCPSLTAAQLFAYGHVSVTAERKILHFLG